MLDIEESTATDKKVSIIIPCYNCENTIDYCVNAVLAQTIGIHNIEIILVNDASTDNTLAKLYAYEKRYPDTFLIINCTENGRQGTARNIALSYAEGEYIAYVDADDVMERNMYELLYQAARQTDAEVVVANNKRVSQVPSLDLLQNDSLLVKDILEIQTTENRKMLLQDESINNSPCNKLYQRQFLLAHDIYFAEQVIYEDIFFTMLMKGYVSKLCILDNVFYYHIIRKDSTSMNKINVEQRIFDYLAVCAATVEEYKRRGIYELYQYELLKWYVNSYLACAVSDVGYVGYDKGMNPEYLRVMDDSVEQLFPGMLDMNGLHDLLLKVMKKRFPGGKAI